MQYQYGEQAQGKVTINWRTAQRIVPNDWLVMYLSKPARCFAIGKVISPRLPATHHDSVERTLRECRHLYNNGIVLYNDAPAFYENFDDPLVNSDEPWAQRIDVEDWLYFVGDAEPFQPNRIGDHFIRPGPSFIETIYGIDETLFEQIRDGLAELAPSVPEPNLSISDPKDNLVKSMKILLESFKNIVFQGPPGTSKTYSAKLLAASVVLGEDDTKKLEQAIRGEGNPEQNNFSKARFPGEGPKGSWSIVQFHPAYNYEDFVRGIEVKGNGATVSYNAVRRIFDRMAQAAWKVYRKDAENCPKYVLIIDEINRAHLAAVLGELIYALEYRGSPVDSPYAVRDQDEDGKDLPLSTQIIVPPNLYIIGTMNTADRSIGHIDYAVRRRFAFVPLLPEEEPISSLSGKKLFREIKNLFKAENGGRAKTLSPEFHADDVQPGHTYFITQSSEIIDELANKFTYQVYPLLREYFKDGILINAPKLFGGKLALDTPIPPKEALEIVKSFLGRP